MRIGPWTCVSPYSNQGLCLLSVFSIVLFYLVLLSVNSKCPDDTEANMDLMRQHIVTALFPWAQNWCAVKKMNMPFVGYKDTNLHAQIDARLYNYNLLQIISTTTECREQIVRMRMLFRAYAVRISHDDYSRTYVIKLNNNHRSLIIVAGTWHNALFRMMLTIKSASPDSKRSFDICA